MEQDEQAGQLQNFFNHDQPYFVWTRGEEECQEDLQVWAKIAGQRPILVPCLRVEAFAPEKIVLPKLNSNNLAPTLIITSPRSVKIMHESPILRPILAQAKICLSHGPKTSHILAQLGYPVRHINEARTARELAEWVLAHCAPQDPFLFISPREPAFDITHFLSSRRFQIQSLVCYETLAEVPDTYQETLRQILFASQGTSRQGIWCFASPTAVFGLMNSIHKWQLPQPAPSVVAAIGPTTAQAAARYFSNVTTSHRNTIEDLIRTACSLTF